MLIAVGSDHAGFEVKNKILEFYKNNNKYILKDFGTYNNNSCDYPVIAEKIGILVSKQEFNMGILICGSGVGMSIAANKINNVRAALCYEPELARLSRAHNDANILCLGARFTNFYKLINIINIFLETKFDLGRHENRVNQILNLEQKY